MLQRHAFINTLCSGLVLYGCGSNGEEPAVKLYQDLGDLHWAVTTSSVDAQSYFDQGLRLTYGFNHGEAIRSFAEAERLDSTCSMCAWGQALALGPNINSPMDPGAVPAAVAAVERAAMHAAHGSPIEQALIAAMRTRYRAEITNGRASLDSTYATAMTTLADTYRDNDDAQVLAAEALMLLSPWNYWTPELAPRAGTEELVARLSTVTERNPRHPGACHFFIHAVEAAYPERGIGCAERLAALMPGAGHLVHMPAHIYIRVGRYADAIDVNVHATHADEQHIADQAPDGVYALAYYPHNYHFLYFAASMAGRRAFAEQSAMQLAERVDTSMMRAPGLEALQHFLVAPIRGMVRFGAWDAVLVAPAPPADLAYPTATWHWARGMALASRRDLDGAGVELSALRRLANDSSLQDKTIWNINPMTAVLAVAERTLAAEIERAKGNLREAVRAYSEAASLEDALTYDEPPQWEIPVRHFLGAVLLQAGQAKDAERVYREDLARFPTNGWSLVGLALALDQQGRAADAAQARSMLAESWRAADITPTASRY